MSDQGPVLRVAIDPNAIHAYSLELPAVFEGHIVQELPYGGTGVVQASQIG